MRALKSGAVLLLFLFMVSLLEGCTGAGTQLCRPDFLRHPEMRFEDNRNGYLLDDHIYFSKEASGGGRATGGGGCGCN